MMTPDSFKLNSWHWSERIIAPIYDDDDDDDLVASVDGYDDPDVAGVALSARSSLGQ